MLLVVELHGAVLVAPQIQIDVLELLVDQTHGVQMTACFTSHQNQHRRVKLDRSQRLIAKLHLKDQIKVVNNIIGK